MASMPEIKIEPLQPIDFGPNDEDRVKDLFEKVFLFEYEVHRKEYGALPDRAEAEAGRIADVTSRKYRNWLKKQEPTS